MIEWPSTRKTAKKMFQLNLARILLFNNNTDISFLGQIGYSVWQIVHSKMALYTQLQLPFSNETIANNFCS